MHYPGHVVGYEQPYMRSADMRSSVIRPGASIMQPMQGYGQVTSLTRLQALGPTAARVLSTAAKPMSTTPTTEEEKGLPTIAYVGIGIAAVGAVWWFFLRKKTTKTA